MKTTHLFIIGAVIVVTQFILDGLYHGLIMKSYYDVWTAGFYYPPGQQKWQILFFSEITLFGGLTFFVSRALNGGSLLKAMIMGGLYCFSMGGTFVIVNSALMPGWGIAISLSEVLWNTCQGMLAGAILFLLSNRLSKKSRQAV